MLYLRLIRPKNVMSAIVFAQPRFRELQELDSMDAPLDVLRDCRKLRFSLLSYPHAF